MKKILLSTLLIVAFCAALMGGGFAGQDVEATKAAEGENYKFGLTIQTLDNNHWTRLIGGVESAMREGDELVVLNAEYDTSKQITQLEDLIAQECDVIFFVAVDGAAIKPGLVACNEAGIPVIGIDIEADTREQTTTVVVTDNLQAGEVMGEAFLETTGGEAKVGLLGFTAVPPARLREEGFRSIVEGVEGVEIVTYQEAFPNTEDAIPVLENMLQAQPEITDFVCINDLQALGAVQVCKAQDRADIRIYGVDGNPDAVNCIVSGTMTGTSAQFPAEEGSTAVEMAYKFLAGESVDEAYLVPCEWINSTNGEEYIASLGLDG